MKPSRKSPLTRPKFSKTIIGEGLPNSKTKAKGNLVINFTTSFPQVLTNEQKELLKQAFQQG